MPNGGSDCCGTCWFNSANSGQAGYPKSETISEGFCTIRDLKVENPFYTYCANHPHHNPERIDIPLGPVYVAEGSSAYDRRILEKSPDSEKIRHKLLDLLDNMEEEPQQEYPSGTHLEDEIIKQLMEFREQRAVPGLRRVARFRLDAKRLEENPFLQNRFVTVGWAIEALGAIGGEAELDDLEQALHRGLEGTATFASKRRFLPRIIEKIFSARPTLDKAHSDPMVLLRYHAIAGLRHCRSQRANEILLRATHDPHPDVAAFAREASAGVDQDS